MVELRKRKEAPPPPPPAKKRAPSKSKAKKNAPRAVEPTTEAAKAPEIAVDDAPAAAAVPPPVKAGPPKVGDSIDLDGFGGEVQTHGEETTTLAKLAADSKVGVALFTYPKASTPGCTTQVCLFRDAYADLTAAGLSIYGLSNDSTKANNKFVEKQKLQYPLLCDPKQTLISAIGLKKAPKGTTRGVFVVDQSGKVLAAEAGGPAATLEVVKRIVAALGGDTDANGLKKAEEGVENEKKAGKAGKSVNGESKTEEVEDGEKKVGESVEGEKKVEESVEGEKKTEKAGKSANGENTAEEAVNDGKKAEEAVNDENTAEKLDGADAKL